MWSVMVENSSWTLYFICSENNDDDGEQREKVEGMMASEDDVIGFPEHISDSTMFLCIIGTK